MAAATHFGLGVSRAGGPNDIRVAGHDDHPLSRFANPPLTTVAQDHVRMANLAVDLVAGRIVDEGRQTSANVRLLEAKLIMRDTA